MDSSTVPTTSSLSTPPAHPKAHLLQLPTGARHHVYRCGSLVALFTQTETDKTTNTVALLSLVTGGKLWEREVTGLTPNLSLSVTGCQLSEAGLLVATYGTTLKRAIHRICFSDGLQHGELPGRRRHYMSIDCVGTRILGYWALRFNDDPSACWLPENTHKFYGELEADGTLHPSIQLDYTRGRWTSSLAMSERYWVRLSGSEVSTLSPIIEIVDRQTTTLYTIALPSQSDEVKFHSPSIVGDQLVFGRTAVRPWSQHAIKVDYEPTICLFDLGTRSLLGEFRTGGEKGEIKHLVATQQYAAWLEYRGSSTDEVRFLDLATKTTKVATLAPSCIADHSVNLNIAGTRLSVIYAGGSTNGRDAYWRRQVIDMTDGTLVSDVRYLRYPWSECSVSNGILFISDPWSNPKRVTFEELTAQLPSDPNHPFMAKQLYPPKAL